MPGTSSSLATWVSISSNTDKSFFLGLVVTSLGGYQPPFVPVTADSVPDIVAGYSVSVKLSAATVIPESNVIVTLYSVSDKLSAVAVMDVSA